MVSDPDTLFSAFVVLMRALGASILFFGGLYTSYFFSARVLKYVQTPVNGLAAIVLWQWSASVLFHALAGAGQFKTGTAAVIVLSAALVVRTRHFRFVDFLRPLIEGVSALRKNVRSRTVLVFIPLSIPLFFTAVRTLFLPPLGWDFLLYHGVKAGIWVQSGSHRLLDAPQGWNLARTYFGGGEIFTAWTMLPFRGDLGVGFLDAMAWIWIGAILFRIGKEFGLTRSLNLTSIFYCLTLPPLWLSVGSGYVEPMLNAALLSGFLFIMRFIRYAENQSLAVGLLSLGIAAAIKLPALLLLSWISLCTLCFIAFHPSARKKHLIGWCLGVLGAGAVTGPWLAWNVQETGFPFAHVPVRAFGLELGRANETLSWYQDDPQSKPYRFDTEWAALLEMFRWPTERGHFLDRFLIVPAILFLLALYELYRKKTAWAVMITGWMLCMLASFYHPGFSIVRLRFAGVTGRFLLPAFLPLVMIAASRVTEKTVLSVGFHGFMIASILVREVRLFSYGWAKFEWMLIPVAACAAVLLLAVMHTIVKRGPVRTVLLFLIPVFILPVVSHLRNRIRYPALGHSTVLHPFRRYWVPAAQKTDSPRECYRIAFTSGAQQVSSNWFWYNFLGSRLQNTPFYIPIAKSGKVIPYGSDYYQRPFGDRSSWTGRILAQRIDWVMSFTPPSIELEWMEKDPERFQRIEGDGQTWGLYSVRVTGTTAEPVHKKSPRFP